MKIGIGLYRSMLTKENYKFAKQIGCTHIIAHLVDYFNTEGLHGTDEETNYGMSKAHEEVWSYEAILRLKEEIEAEGLKLYAIENFAPADWYDILLDGPTKREQMEGLKEIIRNVGKAGIPAFGYNFSLAGVWGHVMRPNARGGAIAAGFSDSSGPHGTPIKKGQIWNMTYDKSLSQDGDIGEISPKQLWERFAYFIKELTPIAEESGVRLAAHPDDPPMKFIRNTPRLVYQPELYQKLLDIYPSYNNGLEFCMGTIQEMSTGNVYDSLNKYSQQKNIVYVHVRNVVGKVPDYQEVFIDEGDIDIVKALSILIKNEFEGVLIPDHTPQIDSDAPWYMGMAHAIGYIKGIVNCLEEKS